MDKDIPTQKVIGKSALIGQILVKKGLISSEQLDKALKIQKKERGLIGDILVKQGYITEESLSVALASQFDLGFIPMERYKISKEVLKLIPKELVYQYCLVPLEMIGGVLTIVMANPFDEAAIKAIQSITHCKVVRLIGTKTEIEKIIQANY
ncbi:MAG: hypothetical protein A2984_01320 [Omnitrophica WOR_2 bacterium RIFCSPLOWO2_01_FULL_41_12]|nr:MAG: hypothetical protein A2984_01320 [Omnitrophica WOR_2 bacterium RIFCSPLOWO2_01_FULL_41_12]